MKNIFDVLYFGIREPLKRTNYFFLLIAVFLTMFVLFIFIPVWTVPGNTFATQLRIFTLRDYALFFILSFLYALFLSMQIFIMRQKKKKKKITSVGTVFSGGLGSLFAGIVGTAFCASCLAPFLALFGIGFGGVVFVLNYRWYFVFVTIIFMFIAIYLTARKINKICNLC